MKGWFIMNKLKLLYTKYRHGIPLLIYMALYLAGFTWLENVNKKNFRVIHMSIDDKIPFCELFIIPYILWFVYVAATVVFLFFRNKQDYCKCCAFLFTGMTIFLLVSALWPNGHHLRPSVMPRDNLLTQIVALLWRLDTPTNLWPSIHVYNSMGAHFAIMHCAELENKKGIRIGSFVLAFSIILSTMFLKQHSVFDVLTGIALGAVMYVTVYRREAILAARAQRRMKRRISM